MDLRILPPGTLTRARHRAFAWGLAIGLVLAGLFRLGEAMVAAAPCSAVMPLNGLGTVEAVCPQPGRGRAAAPATVHEVPEPAPLALMGSALAALAFVRAKRS